MALTRLRLAAQGAVLDSEAVAAAFVGMAETFPGKVLTAIGAWLARVKSPTRTQLQRHA
jgi:hypothetical protein